MESVKRKETTIGNMIRWYFTRSKRQEEQAAADEKDFISSLPLDLKLQILAKLPLKSVAKFISLSKLWSSIVRGKDLTEFFISRSSTRPSILIILDIKNSNKFEFRTYSQDEPSSGNCSIITSSITGSITPKPILRFSPPVHGLICAEQISHDEDDTERCQVICNPTTGQFVTLPRVKTRSKRANGVIPFLGYDPVNCQHKVLCMENVHWRPEPGIPSEGHQVFTLGAKKKAWRMIECKHPHSPATNGICRDGVVYYGAWYNNYLEESILMSFDVRSEDFGVIKLPEAVNFRRYRGTNLVNYREKIAIVECFIDSSNVVLWILQDAKKQEWSKISLLVPELAGDILICHGAISTGEIIFTPFHYTNLSFILYYDLKRNNTIRVYIEGGDNGPITFFVDHVESLMFLQKKSLIPSSLVWWK